MTTIIRRYRRRQNAPTITALAAVLLALVMVVGIVMLIWAKGGPQPQHEIVIAIPAPEIPAGTGRRA